jgi:VIT1/CCC1 family predicted Fe2+/Mn2+ transporter
MAKKDVKVEALGDWNKYATLSAEQASAELYSHAANASNAARGWYWTSIKSKKFSSVVIRLITFGFLVFGVLLPILAALLSDTAERLYCTQIGVAALALAGLLQTADRVFGWSSGWLRYITTVTAMEGATRKFELE